MIGIKHEDKNKILDYCIRKCVENHDALLGIRTSWSNAIIRTAQLDYDTAVLSRNMGYTQRNKLITIS